MDFLVWTTITVGIFIILSTSLNLTVGFAGVLSLAHAAFYGIGAYCSALLSQKAHISFWFSALSGGIVAGLFGVLLGIPSLRLRGDYFAIATLGFGEIIRMVLNNWKSLTGGAFGIPGIPHPELFGFHFNSPQRYLIIVLIFTAASVFVIYRISNSPFGDVLRAIRDDETSAKALGRNTTSYKILALSIGAIFAGISGALYAHVVTYIDPTSFTLFESILILCMVVLGGMGSIKGSIVGAFALILIPEILRFLGLPSRIAGPFRQILYSMALILLVIFRPQGMWGESDIAKKR